MEEGPMSMSLLYALLDVQDAAGLAAASPYSRAGRYALLTDNQKRRVQDALYDAFYAILESRRIEYMPGTAGPLASRGMRASSGMGAALGRVLSRDLSPLSPEETSNIATLGTVLRDVVDQAVNDALVR
jgi:hypothetical protein